MPSQGPLQMKDGDSSRRLRGSWPLWKMALKTKTKGGLRSWEAGRGLLADGSTVNTPLARSVEPIMCSLCSFKPLNLWSSVKGNGKLIHQRGESAGKPNREHLWPGPAGVPAALEPPHPTGACSLKMFACPCCFLVYAWIPRYFWFLPDVRKTQNCRKGSRISTDNIYYTPLHLIIHCVFRISEQ